MALICKQLWKQITKGKVFLILLILLITLTSLSFFFVMFSIDGNIGVLSKLQTLSENQQLYQNALNANTTLALTFLASLICLTAFVLVMFFYRFFRANKKQIGCMKALGFKDNELRFCFVLFVGGVSILGALFGLIGGCFLSDVLINANTQTYAVTGLVKGISASSLLIGLVTPTLIFSVVAFLCYGFVKGKEPGVLLSGNIGQNRYSVTLKMADWISKLASKSRRFSLRIALRKPVSIVLIFAAVMSFSVCMILGRSLNISSRKVFASQTLGHNYEYSTQYLDYQTTEPAENAIYHIDSPAVVSIDHFELERKVIGIYNLNEVFQLQNSAGEWLETPQTNTVYIGLELSEIYNVKIGDTLRISIAGNAYNPTVAEIAVNAETGSVYMNGGKLAEILGASPGAYTGIYSRESVSGGISITNAERIDVLNRNAVSNNISAIINQATGVLVGIILIFLALYVNFQDNTHDMLILNLMGYKMKEIRKMLVNIYFPILWIAFAVTLAPTIFLAKNIQHSLSISTNDYMPFGTDLLTIIIAFGAVNLIYWLVQLMFGLFIKRTIAKQDISELVYEE